MTPRQELELRRAVKSGDQRAELELRRLGAKPTQQQASQPKSDPLAGLLQANRANPNPGGLLGALSPNKGMAQLSRSMLGSAIAEPVAGLAGIGAAITGGAGAGSQAVAGTRSALTPTLGAEGKQEAARIGKAIPDWMKSAGKYVSGKVDDVADVAAEKFGPAAGAAVQTLPTAAASVLPFAAARGMTKPTAVMKGTDSAITGAAPTTEALKSASSALYKSIDDMGVTISPGPYSRLVAGLQRSVTRKGGHPKTTPKAMAAIDELAKSVDPMAPPPKLSDLDTYREISKAAASSIEPREKMLGRMIMEKLDDFVDKAAVNKSLQGAGDTTKVGGMYKQARDLWGRQKRSDMITEAVSAAQRRASGIENGVRVELRKITNNPKKSKWFSKDELADLNTVVAGSRGANWAKAVGRLAPMGGAGATNTLTALAGIGVGGAAGGWLGGIAVPAVGMISRPLARRLTLKNAGFADAVVRAGKDGKKIASAYLRHTAEGKRVPGELAELLFKRDASVDALLAGDKLMVEAAEMASKAKAGMAAGAIPGPAQQTAPQEPEQE